MTFVALSVPLAHVELIFQELVALFVDFGLGLLKVDSTVLRLELVVDARLAAVVWNVLLH